MASENEEKYGTVVGTVKSQVEKEVSDTVESAKQMGQLASNLGGYLKRDISNGLDWLMKSPEEKAAIKAAEKAEEEKKKQEEDDAKKAEEQRMAELQKSYIVHTAVILCDKAARESYVVVPTGHGEFIHGIPQLNIGDSVPFVNIQSFGVCMSPENPTVQAAAKEILDKVKNRKKSFMDKVLDLFTKDPAEEIGADLASKCAGVCTLPIYTDWMNGKEKVLIDGKPALLGRCTLQCGFGGNITLYTSGQRE
ncbi:MAG: DUF4280 domain-containing protein [Clostridiaceae bacterium]